MIVIDPLHDDPIAMMSADYEVTALTRQRTKFQRRQSRFLLEFSDRGYCRLLAVWGQTVERLLEPRAEVDLQVSA